MRQNRKVLCSTGSTDDQYRSSLTMRRIGKMHFTFNPFECFVRFSNANSIEFAMHSGRDRWSRQLIDHKNENDRWAMESQQQYSHKKSSIDFVMWLNNNLMCHFERDIFLRQKRRNEKATNEKTRINDTTTFSWIVVKIATGYRHDSFFFRWRRVRNEQ